jgi:hypothetical protein
MKNDLKLGITAVVLGTISVVMSLLTLFVFNSITLGIGGIAFALLAIIAGYHAVKSEG